MKDFKVDIRDLILVSVDKKIKDYAKQAKGFDVGEEPIPRGKVKELAILEEGKTQFILISEFEELKIREVKHYVPLNSVGEYDFEKVEINLKNGQNAFMISEEEIDFGVDFSDLKERNYAFVQTQFKVFLREWSKAKVDAVKRRILQKNREKYLNFNNLVENKENER